VCQSKDIRNLVKQFQKLKNCTVIEGYLQILLIDYAEASDYENLQFPELREITDYLLLYRVYGLRTLSHIFPNLAVIRGQKLFFNYALVAFEMPDLEDVGLGSLTHIMRGAVRLEKNPNLCYINTIDWQRITSVDEESNFIMQNKDIDECVNVCPRNAQDQNICYPKENADGTPDGYNYLCWNGDKCQKGQ